MPGGRAILRALDLQLKVRVVLKTIDGQVIVRPPAPDSVTLCDAAGEPAVEAWLSDEGKAAWNRGEGIKQEHIWGMGDIRRIVTAEF